ncbi:MAG TPA: response regulator transcription factor [Actinomycetota bacterium]|nr:response regulator transcription factor [Actinomycetota bacterium]
MGFAGRVLVVEDEKSIVGPVRRALKREGYEVEVSDNGTDALRVVAEWDPTVVLLDLMLPDMDGHEVARRIRAASHVPIIMVTARGAESERVAGLELGADDYVVKPFSLPELLARLRAVGRRVSAAPPPGNELSFKDIRLDLGAYRAYKGGSELHLSKKEFELLRMVMAKNGNLARRDDLITAIWHIAPNESGKTLDVHMSWLRKKIGDDPKRPRYIQTVRGVGFRLVDS